MNAFDWKGQPSQAQVPDTSCRRHKLGKATLDIGLNSGHSTTVAQMDLQGNVLKLYPSIQSAARDLGIARWLISNCINGKRESANGFKFKVHARIGTTR